MNILSREEIIPLTPQAAAVLLALAEGPKHSYALARFCESDSSSTLKMSAGSMHHLLKRLVIQGLVGSGGMGKSISSPYQRKLYQLTELGRAVLKWETDRQAEYVGLARMRMRKYDERA
jgi:PadR family transcriptional regulator, regulatory protein PadR